MNDAKCPYCGSDAEINHDDGYGYDEGKTFQQECGNCDKTFTFTTSVHFYYETAKAECLNGGEHKWKPTITYPKEYTRMVCSDCGEERKPTQKEMNAIMEAK